MKSHKLNFGKPTDDVNRGLHLTIKKQLNLYR